MTQNGHNYKAYSFNGIGKPDQIFYHTRLYRRKDIRFFLFPPPHLEEIYGVIEHSGL